MNSLRAEEKRVSGLLEVAALILLILGSSTVLAEESCKKLPNEELARVMWSRAVGEYRPSDEASITEIKNLLDKNKPQEAAAILVQQPGFIDRTMFDFADRDSNAANIPKGQMTSFIAFYQGIANDDRSIKDLYADGLYIVKSQYNPPAVSIRNENHWRIIQTDDLRSSEALEFQAAPQWQNQQAQDVPAGYDDFAGILTLSSLAAEVYEAGTNRKPLMYILKNQLCRSFEAAHDSSVGDRAVARDVDRADVQAFNTKCVGCHGAGDAIRDAFSFIDAATQNGNVFIRFSNSVVPKYSVNSATFPDGHVTTDRSWENLFTFGENAKAFGWRGPSSQGVGVKELSALVSNSEAFTNCMVEKAYRQIWLQEPNDLIRPQLLEIARAVEGEGQTFRQIFKRVLSMKQCL